MDAQTRQSRQLTAALAYGAAIEALATLKDSKLAHLAHAYSAIENAIRHLKVAEDEVTCDELEPGAIVLAAARTQYDAKLRDATAAERDACRECYAAGLRDATDVQELSDEALDDEHPDFCAHCRHLGLVIQWYRDIEASQRLAMAGHYQ